MSFTEAVLVTGATSGVGLEVARTLKRGGRRLLLGGRSSDRIGRLKDEFPEEIIWQFDLGELEGIEASLSEVISSNHLRIVGYVHSAGVFNPVPVKTMTRAACLSSFNVNVFSPMIITKVLKSYRLNVGGLRSVVLVSSNISDFGGRGMSVYAASKAALDGFMRSAAIELSPHVRVNSVRPGAMRTEMTEAIFAGSGDAGRLFSRYPRGVGTPAQVASVVEFLLGDGSQHVNGQAISIDGGATVNMGESVGTN